MINVIFVSYYRKYLERSLFELVELCLSLKKPVKIILVNNSNLQIEQDFISQYNHKMVELEVIQGTNYLWEFSGWKEGLDFINIISPEDYFIFANDTFCHHRKWGELEKYYFRNAFDRHFKNMLEGITGNVNTFGGYFEIEDLRAESWVSTYLFGIDGKTLKLSIHNIFLDASKLSELAFYKMDLLNFSSHISMPLTSHVNEWMFPKSVAKGWYNANLVPQDIVLKKVWAILNEKYLSAYIHTQGNELYHYLPMYIVFYFRITSKISSIINRIKCAIS